MNMEKFTYLARMLAQRTHGKIYEGYVVNYLWFKLADETIQPVTQQYVNRHADGSDTGLVNYARLSTRAEGEDHAFIDLYFPQFRIGVECDESQHFATESSQESDKRRTEDIKRAIPGYREYRVPVQIDDHGNRVTPEQIQARLDEIIAQIRQAKADMGDKFRPWRTDLQDWEIAQSEHRLRVADGLMFRNGGEIRELFGRGNGLGTKVNNFRTNFRLSDGRRVWCPTLSIVTVDGATNSTNIVSTNSKGVLNLITTDGQQILEATPKHKSGKTGTGNDYLTPDEYRRDRAEHPSPWTTCQRITFAKAKDALGNNGFQFVGVFESTDDFVQKEGIWYTVKQLVSIEVALDSQK